MNAQQFASDWINSLNSHDLNDILSHYADDIEITTPVLKLAAGTDSGAIKGNAGVRSYWSKPYKISRTLIVNFMKPQQGSIRWHCITGP